MSNPLVSICVPTYNRAACLRQSLKSICGQDYAPLEILISDNCSDDETDRVCREIAEADPRVRYVCQPRNIGLYANHNVCIAESRGEFLCFFHDHDERDLRVVSEYVAFLRQNPEVGVVCSDWELIDEAGERIGVREHDVKPITPGLEYIGRTVRSGRSSIAAQGAMIRRSALRDVYFDEEGPIGFGDFVVWFQIAERASIGHLRRRLWRCRVSRQSQSTRTIASLIDDYRENLTRYCDGHLKRWPEHVEMVDRWRSYIDRFAFWALVYEVGLHFRKGKTTVAKRSHFEILDYRLSAEEFHRVIEQLEVYRSRFLQYGILFVIKVLIRLKLTWPLAWTTHHYSRLRGLLGLG